jgi:peroxiredoxin
MRFPRMSGNAWVCTIITGILLLSGAEQAYRAMHPEGPPPVKYTEAQPPGPQLGDIPPNWTLPDPHGKSYSLAQYRGKPLVVNFYCGCQRCQELAKLMSGWQKKKHVPMVGLVTFKPEFFKEFRQKTGADFPLVLDEGKEIGKKWASEICPRVWVLDGKGRAVWTNPPEPDMITPTDTAQMVRKSYDNPIIPTRPKTPVATKSPGTAG